MNRPAATILAVPKRAIKCPVKNDGTNIARTWAETMSAAVFCSNPHPTTANGVDVITRFINAYDTIAQIIATATVGVFMISQRLRPIGAFALRGLGFGMFSARNKTDPTTFMTMIARYVPIKGTTIDWAVTLTSCGPINAEASPPAMTYEIALGRNASLAVSAAANR